MKKYFTNYIKKLIYLFVFIGFTSANAGSYDDFFKAITRDDPRAIKELLNRGFDPNTPDPKGQNGLYLALREPSLKAAQVLIDWPKTDVNILNVKGESPLMLAALKGQQDLVEKLIKKGLTSTRPAGHLCTTPPPAATWPSSACCWKTAPILMPNHPMPPRP